MSTTSAVTTAPTQATRLPVGTWQIDPVHSSLEFQVRNMGLVTVKGFFADFEGTLEVDENGRTQAEGTVEAASVHTRSEKRDEHLRAPDFFDVERHPEIAFRVTGVEPDGDLSRVQRRELAHELRPLDCARAHHDPRRACRQEVAPGCDAPDASAGLHAARDRGADRLDDREVDALAGAGGVEVDDVNPLRACVGEDVRHAHRVVAVHRLGCEIASVQPHDLPAPQVDRGIQVEGHAPTARPSSTGRRCLRSSPRPAGCGPRP